MKIKAFPQNFSSLEEYETYCGCYKKLSLTDTIFVYVTEDMYRSLKKTQNTVEATIIGEIKDKRDKTPNRLLLGTKNKHTCCSFWPISDVVDLKDKYLLVDDIAEYKYAFWMYVNDIRIAKIIKHNYGRQSKA